jgi:uncharacterized membrane protein
MIALFIAGIIVIVVLLVWFIHRRTAASDGLTEKERKQLPSEQKEILSMLRQHGGPMLQTDLANLLPYDIEEIAEALKDLESRDLIRREWKTDNKTYKITSVS